MFWKKKQTAAAAPEREPTHASTKREAVRSFVDFAAGDGLPQWPLEVFLEVSNICDLKCAMCPTFSALNANRFTILKKNERGLIAYEQATTPLETVLQHALIVHAFGYGEPTIHPQFREFVQYLSQFDVMVDFFTHGMHLSEEMCEFLVESGVVRISVSFSGATAEEYENVYLGGEFDRVLRGLRTLAAAKERAGSDYPIIEINSLGFRHHIDKLPDFVRLMGETGANLIHLKPLQTYDAVRELHGHTAVMRPDIEGPIIEEAQAVAKQYGVRLASAPFEQTSAALEKYPDNPLQSRHKGYMPLSEEVITITDLKEVASSREKKAEQKEAVASPEEEPTPEEIGIGRFMTHRGTPCLEPFKTLYASFNGKVYPCCFKNDRGVPLGNLNESDGDDIWRGERTSSIQENILQGEYPADICGRCLKSATYPGHHNLVMKMNQYCDWYQHRFGEPFSRELQKAVKKLPDNAAIVAAHSRA